jgi:histidine triad (HIT) family protein
MDECIFCRIARRELPATEVYRDESVVAIQDLSPQAPTHLLVMPIEHYAGIADVSSADAALAGRLIATAAQLGTQRGGERGFRLVINTGTDGGQTVGHAHLHVLAGRPMTWPPG